MNVLYKDILGESRICTSFGIRDLCCVSGNGDGVVTHFYDVAFWSVHIQKHAVVCAGFRVGDCAFVLCV